MAAKISRIENGLRPNLQIAGDNILIYHIEQRLQELGIPGVSIAFYYQGEIEWAKEIQRIRQTRVDGLLTSRTVNDMLTPGMNDYVLGLGVSEHSYGHGGADRGFPARLIAWKEPPHAVVIMVNSDNGSIIQEILLSIAEEYHLPAITPTTRVINAQPEEELKQFVGKYNIPALSDSEILIKDTGLELTAAFLDSPIFLLPESDSTFFDKEDVNTSILLLRKILIPGFQV